MSSARRPVLTAVAAGSVLCALWFVPSANASSGRATSDGLGTRSSQPATGEVARAATDPEATDRQARLADTGTFDSTPFLVGGTAFLTVGAGFVAYSVRRERLGF
ncbi:hypothetical protein AAH978_12385 [Streptomyces sp. ZYX-F-203]